MEWVGRVLKDHRTPIWVWVGLERFLKTTELQNGFGLGWKGLQRPLNPVMGLGWVGKVLEDHRTTGRPWGCMGLPAPPPRSPFLGSPTLGTGADAAQSAGGAAAVLLLVVGVAQLAGARPVRQPHLDVGEVAPIRARSQRDVPHPRRHQSAHVLPRRAPHHPTEHTHAWRDIAGTGPNGAVGVPTRCPRSHLWVSSPERHSHTWVPIWHPSLLSRGLGVAMWRSLSHLGVWGSHPHNPIPMYGSGIPSPFPSMGPIPTPPFPSMGPIPTSPLPSMGRGVPAAPAVPYRCGP